MRLAPLALLLVPALALAARYDPGADRAALRQAATVCHATIVDATGLPLETEKVPTIIKGLDEGLRLAASAAEYAAALDTAARARSTEMATGTDSLERRIKDPAEAVAKERKRTDRDAAELAEFKKKIDKLSDEDQKKYLPRVAKAERALAAAEEALHPAEGAVAAMKQRSLETRAAVRLGQKSLAEVSAADTDTVRFAAKLPEPVAQFKERLATLDVIPRETSRTRAQQKIGPTRDASLVLFQAADRACNRADDFRHASTSYDDAANAFETALPAADPSVTKPFLVDAEKMLDLIRELLKKSI